MYDIVVIGAGVTGLSAALYAGKSGKSVALVDTEFGGKLLDSKDFEAFPWSSAETNTQQVEAIVNKLVSYKNVSFFNTKVSLVSYRYGIIRISMEAGYDIFGKSVICATGKKPVKLKLEKGRDYTTGIYYSARTDREFLANKKVVVVGNPNLVNSAITKLKELNAEIVAVVNKIEETKVKNKVLTAVKLNSTGKTVECDAIFVALGEEPNTKIVKPLQIVNKTDYIIADSTGKTSTMGIFAAGDCTVNQTTDVLDAIYGGTVAAKSAIKYLNK